VHRNPHHGVTLERGGHLLDMTLGMSPYAAPFARLGKARSASITDLRFGNLQATDWQGRDAHDQRRDDRVPTPLPPGVAVYLMAGTLKATSSGVRDRVVGDGLVPLASALGQHRSPASTLAVPAARQCVPTEASHFGLRARPCGTPAWWPTTTAILTRPARSVPL
jgi:hypothetical protein